VETPKSKRVTRVVTLCVLRVTTLVTLLLFGVSIVLARGVSRNIGNNIPRPKTDHHNKHNNTKSRRHSLRILAKNADQLATKWAHPVANAMPLQFNSPKIQFNCFFGR
jgi:hypothetical protein